MAFCLHTFLWNFLKLGQLLKKEENNKTDRTTSYEKISIHLKVNALRLKFLNTLQSNQALHFF